MVFSQACSVLWPCCSLVALPRQPQPVQLQRQVALVRGAALLPESLRISAAWRTSWGVSRSRDSVAGGDEFVVGLLLLRLVQPAACLAHAARGSWLRIRDVCMLLSAPEAECMANAPCPWSTCAGGSGGEISLGFGIAVPVKGSAPAVKPGAAASQGLPAFLQPQKVQAAYQPHTEPAGTSDNGGDGN